MRQRLPAAEGFRLIRKEMWNASHPETLLLRLRVDMALAVGSFRLYTSGKGASLVMRYGHARMTNERVSITLTVGECIALLAVLSTFAAPIEVIDDIENRICEVLDS